MIFWPSNLFNIFGRCEEKLVDNAWYLKSYKCINKWYCFNGCDDFLIAENSTIGHI